MPQESADAGEPLQFQVVEPLEPDAPATPVAPAMLCVGCRTVIHGGFHQLETGALCDACRDQVHAQSPTRRGGFFLAAVFGIAAAVAGAAIYYAVLTYLHLEIGIVAILIGYMVGRGVQQGSRGRGGRRFQVLALILTYWAVGLAYTPVVIKSVMERNSSSSPGTTRSADKAPTDATGVGATGALLGLGVLFALPFAMPVLIVFGTFPSGIISALILGFGMHRAWLMASTVPSGT